jgi:hypothetical protein
MRCASALLLKGFSLEARSWRARAATIDAIRLGLQPWADGSRCAARIRDEAIASSLGVMAKFLDFAGARGEWPAPSFFARPNCSSLLH